MDKKLKRYWFIFQEGKLLQVKDPSFIPNEEAIQDLEIHFIRQLSLGVYEETVCFTAEIGPECLLPAHLITTPIKQSFISAPTRWQSVISKAYSALNWDRTHQFCGRCGNKTLHESSAFERHCPICELNFYPRISPSVIVLIQKEGKILMARSPHFAPGVYGLIAGFVEIGETLEEAIDREVFEEVGIRVKNIKYFGSQPWPFPDSLMLGFYADYAEGEITIDNQEIEEADWYPIDKLPGYPSSSISIANQLITAFITKQKKVHNTF